MSKTQRIFCIVLGIFLVGLIFASTKYGKMATSSVSEFVSGKPNSSPETTSSMNTSTDTYDTTFCRTSDGVSVVLVCTHVISKDKKRNILFDISSTLFNGLRNHLTAKGDYTITNIVVNKKAFDFFTSTTSLSVSGGDVTVYGKIND